MGFCGSPIGFEGVGLFLCLENLFHAQPLRQITQAFFGPGVVLRHGKEEPLVSFHQISHAGVTVGIRGTERALTSRRAVFRGTPEPFHRLVDLFLHAIAADVSVTEFKLRIGFLLFGGFA